MAAVASTTDLEAAARRLLSLPHHELVARLLAQEHEIAASVAQKVVASVTPEPSTAAAVAAPTTTTISSSLLGNKKRQAVASPEPSPITPSPSPSPPPSLSTTATTTPSVTGSTSAVATSSSGGSGGTKHISKKARKGGSGKFDNNSTGNLNDTNNNNNDDNKQSAAAASSSNAAGSGGSGVVGVGGDVAAAGGKNKGGAKATTHSRSRQQLPFDFTRFKRRHIALRVAYIGENYRGFAAQPGEDEATVEGQLFRALILCKLIKDRASSSFSRCGRTDKGVSAMGQVVAFHLRSNLEEGLGMVSDEWKAAEIKAAAAAPTAPMPTPIPSPSPPPASSPAAEDSSSPTDMKTDSDELKQTAAEATTATTTPTTPAKKPISKKERKRAKRLALGGSATAAAAANSTEEKKKKGGEGKEAPKKAEKEELDYALLLNGVLPPDIRVLGWAPVPLDFSARFSCVGRTYKYYFFADGMNLAAMWRAAQKLVGDHDFRNFCKADVVGQAHYIRRIYSFGVNTAADDEKSRADAPLSSRDIDIKTEPIPMPALKNSDGTTAQPTSLLMAMPTAATLGPSDTPADPDTWCVLTIAGNAFLYHQVRCMAAVLFAIGRGLEHESLVDQLLDLKQYPLKPAYEMANEMPLILSDCIFPSSFNWRVGGTRNGLENSERVMSDLHAQWRRQQLRARVTLTFFQHAIDNVRYLEHRYPQSIEPTTATAKGKTKAPSSSKDAKSTAATAAAAASTTETESKTTTTIPTTTTLPVWHDTMMIDRFRGTQLTPRPHQRNRKHNAQYHLPFNKRPLEADTADKIARLSGKKKAIREKVEQSSKQFRHLYEDSAFAE